MFFEDKTSESFTIPTVSLGLTRESLGLTGKLFSVQYENEKRTQQKQKKVNEVDQFCGLMGWKDPKLLANQPEKPTADFLKFAMDKETSNKHFNTNAVEKEFSLKALSVRQKKKMNKELREKTKGKEWFGLPATEVTDEIKNDLQVLQMRSALDPKHFYKKNDLKVLPKYFQVGKYEDSPLDYHNEKHIKKTKNKSIVEDLLGDAEFQKKIKQKYKETVVQQKPKFWSRNSRNKKRDENKNKKRKNYFFWVSISSRTFFASLVKHWPYNESGA